MLFFNKKTKMNKKNDKQLRIELDLYERNYVTVNNLDYILYTNEYVNGFIGEKPLTDNFSIYNYTDQCVIYVKKLILLFDRIKKNTILTTNTLFTRKDLIHHIIKTLEYASYLHPFISNNLKFKRAILEKVDGLFLELKDETDEIKRILYSYPVSCIKARMNS
jgi:hypothetical protein